MDMRQFSLPAGVGLTHMKVYTEPGPDGIPSSSPHTHAVCSEIYFVVAGEGAVELLGAEGYQRIALQPNKVVFFRPGVVHRLENPNKNLEILVIMQNGGLPERGDFILTLPPDVLQDEDAYHRCSRVTDLTTALARRDLAVQGFLPIRDAMRDDPARGRELLHQFYRDARNVLTSKVDGFEWVMKSGAQAELKSNLDAIDFLRLGRTEYLQRGAHWTELDAMQKPERLGMCGHLHPYALDEQFLAEGRKVA